MKYLLPVILCGLAVAAPVRAQYGGNGAGRMPQSGRPPASQGRGGPAPRAVPQPPPRPAVNISQYVAHGVVEAVDVEAGWVTLAYQPIEAMNWQAGRQPFKVAKNKLLEGVRVGDKVGFKMESQQITQLEVIGGAATGLPEREPTPVSAHPRQLQNGDDLARAVFRR